MSKPKKQSSELTVLPPNVIVEKSESEQFEQGRVFWRMIKLSGAQYLAFQVLLGGEIERLKKLFPETRGGDHSKQKSQIETFAQKLEREIGCPKATAYRCAEMYRAAKKHVPELDTDELLNTPLSQLPDFRREKLIAAVRKVTDGKTQQQLMWDLGIAKKPKGLRGGNHGQGNGKDAPDPMLPENQARELIVVPLREIAQHWEELAMHVSDAEMKEIDGLLHDWRAFIKKAGKGISK